MLICTVFSTEAPTSAALMLRGTLFPAIHETDLKQCKTWRLNVSLSFGCVQRATPSTFQSLRGPGPDLPGHQVGRGVLKNTETSIQIACVFIISFYILWSDACLVCTPNAGPNMDFKGAQVQEKHESLCFMLLSLRRVVDMFV